MHIGSATLSGSWWLGVDDRGVSLTKGSLYPTLFYLSPEGTGLRTCRIVNSYLTAFIEYSIAAKLSVCFAKLDALVVVITFNCCF